MLQHIIQTVFAFYTEDWVSLRRVTQLHIIHVDFRNLVGRIFQIHGIAHLIICRLWLLSDWLSIRIIMDTVFCICCFSSGRLFCSIFLNGFSSGRLQFFRSIFLNRFSSIRLFCNIFLNNIRFVFIKLLYKNLVFVIINSDRNRSQNLFTVFTDGSTENPDDSLCVKVRDILKIFAF